MLCYVMCLLHRWMDYVGKPEICTGEFDLYPDLQKHESKRPKYAQSRLDMGGSAATNKKIV